MALIYLVSAVFLGAALVRRVRIEFYAFEAAALAVVVGLLGWTWLVFLSSLVLAYDVACALVVTASALAGVAALYGERSRPVRLRRLDDRVEWALWGVMTAVTGLVLGRLFWTHSLEREADGIYSAGSSWADLGMHSSLITHFAAAEKVPLDQPIASGTDLTYPFLVDFLSAVLLQGGAGLHLSIFVPGLALALGVCQLLFAAAVRIFGHVSGALTSSALFLLLGSAVGTPVAWRDWRAGDAGLFEFVQKPPRDYTTLGDHDANVTNVISHALLPQRSILFGFAVGLAVLILWHEGRRTGRRLPLFSGAVLVGLLPMTHAHSFLVLGAVLVALTVEAALRARTVPRDHLAAGALALALAAPQLAWQQTANGSGTGGRFRFGWMKPPGESVLSYWFANFGLMGLFFLALPVLLWRRPAWRQHLVWYAPLLAVLVVSQVYAFQPFEFDNLKLIFWVYLVAALFAGWLAVEAVRARRWHLAWMVPAGIVVMLPGLLSVTYEFTRHDRFASTDDIELAAWARTNTALDDLFIGADRPGQPVATLAGRRVVLGYRGWLYSYNLPYGDRVQAVGAALAGRADDAALRRYAPDYLVVAAAEDKEWAVDRAALDPSRAVYKNATWSVFELGADGRVRAPAPTPPPPPSPSPSPTGTRAAPPSGTPTPTGTPPPAGPVPQ